MVNKKGTIAETALKLFVERGIRGTTTKEIAERAGIAEGTIYRHYRSKEDLALQLFAGKMGSLLRHLTEAAMKGENPPDQLANVIEAFFTYARHDPISYAYVMGAHQSEFPRLPKEMRKPKDVFVDIVRAGMEKGYFRQMDTELAAALAIGMTIRVIFFHPAGPDLRLRK